MLRLLLIATVISGWVGSGVIQPGGQGSPTASGSVDTLKVLVQSGNTPMIRATIGGNGAGWLHQESWFDHVNETTDGTHFRYGAVNSASATVATFDEFGGGARRTDEANRTAPNRQIFLAFYVGQLTEGHRVETADLFIGMQNFGSNNFSGGYAAVRLDTILADYDMLNSVSSASPTDAAWLDTSYNEVDMDNTQAWVPALADRRDWGDWGPRSAPNDDGLTLVGKGSGGAEVSDVMKIDVRDATQQALDTGLLTRTGGWLIFTVYTVDTSVNLSVWSFGTSASKNDAGSAAFAVVTSSRRGLMAWGDGTVPMTLVWDDNKPADPSIFAQLQAMGEIFSSATYSDTWNSTPEDSMWSASGGVGWDLLPHTKAHDLLGTKTYDQVNFDISREWMDTPNFSSPLPDTLALNNFVWVGGGVFEDRFSFDAIEAIHDNDYHTARAAGVNWHTKIGQITYPSWDMYVNLYAVQSAIGTTIFLEGQSRADFDNLFWRQIDLCWTQNYKSAVMFYNHGYSNEATPEQIGWFFDNIDDSPALSYRSHSWVMGQLASRARIGAAQVTVANGATASIEASAAIHDSVKIADLVIWPDEVWVALGSPAAVPLDVTSTIPPVGLTVLAGNSETVLDWDDHKAVDLNSYNVYLFFDGAPDTALVANVSVSNYTDTSVINGTKHNYFVTALDHADNESGDSNVDGATPTNPLLLDSLPYFAIWHQDPPNSPAPSDSLDALAELDILVIGPFPLEGNTNEPFYTGFRDKMISRNPDMVLLLQAHGATPRNDWESWPVGSSPRKYFDFLAGIADSNGFAKNLAGFVIESDAYPLRFTNIMNPAYADTFASYLVANFAATDIDGEYTGFFLDLSDSSLYNWICDDGNCTEIMDYDQDGTKYSADADEKEAYKLFQRTMTTAIRREFAERGMNNRLIVHNGDYARNNAAFAKSVDGWMWEGWNVFKPGEAANEATWLANFATKDLLVNAQTIPPLVMYSSRLDSSAAFITEPIALAAGVAVNVAAPADYLNSNQIPNLERRLPAPGNQVSIDASGDTLRVVMDNYRAILSIAHTAEDTFTVWPYLVVSGTDTISRGGGWPREDE